MCNFFLAHIWEKIVNETKHAISGMTYKDWLANVVVGPSQGSFRIRHMWAFTALTGLITYMWIEKSCTLGWR